MGLQEIVWEPHPAPRLRSRPAWLRATARAALRAALPLLSASARELLAGAGPPGPDGAGPEDPGRSGSGAAPATLVQPAAGFLLTGGPGTGKTAAVAWLADSAAGAGGAGAHTAYLDCRQLAGEAPADQLAAVMPLVLAPPRRPRLHFHVLIMRRKW